MSILNDFITTLSPRAQAGLKGSVILDIKDHGRVHLDETGARAADDSDTADLTMIATDALFKNILSGDQNPITAVALGKLKIDGNPMRALKISEILSDAAAA